MADQNNLRELVKRITAVWQLWMDRSVPFTVARWVVFAVLVLIYILRVVVLGGYYVVTYGMAIHLLYLLVQFLTPIDANPNDDDEAAALASKAGDEFKPYVPKVQEFKVWRGMMRIVLICFSLTFFGAFDLEVYWPILVVYFVLLFVLQMSARIKHMIKFKYVPWNRAKPKFVSKD